MQHLFFASILSCPRFHFYYMLATRTNSALYTANKHGQAVWTIFCTRAQKVWTVVFLRQVAKPWWSTHPWMFHPDWALFSQMFEAPLWIEAKTQIPGSLTLPEHYNSSSPCLHPLPGTWTCTGELGEGANPAENEPHDLVRVGCRWSSSPLPMCSWKSQEAGNRTMKLRQGSAVWP